MSERKTILLVDDEAEIRAILREFLMRKGCMILEADSGRGALDILKTSTVDVVISDVRMPNGDGIFLAHAIQQLADPRPNVMLLSAYADLSPDSVRDLKSVPVMSKPFQLAQIWRTVDDWLRARYSGAGDVDPLHLT